MTLSLAESSRPFLDYLETWAENLKPVKLADLVFAPETLAILSVDMVEGFCSQGPLSSPRVAGIVDPIAQLLTKAWDSGAHSILFSQDTHEPNAVEFAAWPPHCVRGTKEAETAAALKNLPFFEQISILEKNSISTGINTSLNTWLKDHSKAANFIVVGNCTDLCVYQLATYLRLEANSRQLNWRVIVPAACVATYDRTITSAQAEGGFAHAADFLDTVFLYHMALNGIEVVSDIEL